jgi:hypothetical protein
MTMRAAAPIDFPLDADDFPRDALDTAWIKARFDFPYPRVPPLFDTVRGSMRDKTKAGDVKHYPFEAIFTGGVWREKVGLFDPEHSDHLDQFTNRDPFKGRSVTGLGKNARKDLHQRAIRTASTMREQALAEQQWLLDLFETAAQPVEVVDRDTGEPYDDPWSASGATYATCRGWLITRNERLALVWAHAERIYADDARLIIRPCQ